MSVVKYNQLFRLVDDKRTFNEIGDPQNVLKTAAVMNALMLIITISMCFIPIPFLAPIVIIVYIIAFCTLNIKYMRDFAMGVYQSDNLQIQSSKTKYDSSATKIKDVTETVNKKLEDDYQEVSNSDKTLTKIYENIFEKAQKSLALFHAENPNVYDNDEEDDE